MNCSTISLSRAANGSVLNGGIFLSATAAVTANGTNSAANKCGLASVRANSNNLNLPTKTTSTMCNNNNKNIDLAAKIIQQSNIVCFDVDSTVIREEGIDELAEFCGKGSEVTRVTKEAMGGSMTFQDALRIRLDIIRPTQKQIADFIKLHPSTLTRNVKSFIEQLKENGKQVFLISGGFDCLIEPVCKELDIPLSNLYSNRLMFYYNGEYANFDITQPTAKSGGKAVAITHIKKQNPDALITMIGDGATDLEAVPPADYFIGFGGNVLRAEVFKRAQYYVTDFEQLM